MLVAASLLTLLPSVSGQSRHTVFIQHSLLAAPAPDEARDIFNAGQTFYDEDKFAEAERKFREVVSKFPKNVIADRADYYLIRTLSQQGKKTEALTRIGAFAKQYPKSSGWRCSGNADAADEPGSRNAEYICFAPCPGPGASAQPRRRLRGSAAVTAVQVGRVHLCAGLFSSARASDSSDAIWSDRIQSSDPARSAGRKSRAMFQNNAERAIEIATERLKGDPATIRSCYRT
jgi:tetratricopeptide (TPR) repeat protein